MSAILIRVVPLNFGIPVGSMCILKHRPLIQISERKMKCVVYIFGEGSPVVLPRGSCSAI